MLAHLRRPFLSVEIPSGHGSVFHFLDIFALGCGLEACAALFGGKPLWVVAAGVLGAVSFHLLGTKWPAIRKNLWPRVAAGIDQIGSDWSYRLWALSVIVSYFAISGLLYVHQLRSDLDTYVMPRTVTSRQAEDLREFLSHHESHSITIKINAQSVQDEEARQYWLQLSDAFKRTNWTVEAITPATEPNGGPGLSFYETGQNAKPNNPGHDPVTLLQEAFQNAHIDLPGGASVGAGEYRLFLLVGHRPLEIHSGQPFRSKVGQWIMTHWVMGG
jgi:hypothetical protein